MLDATAAERLVRLRALLVAAQARAGDRSHPGIHGAVVALDAACELALGLCLHELGVPPKRTFPEKMQQIREALGESWQHPGLQGVDELHRTRNNVQHAGVLPDADHLPIWAAEAERFIRALVATVFRCDLTEIYASSAVTDDSLRELLATAERALADEDAPRALEHAWGALESARSRWSSQRPQGFTASGRRAQEVVDEYLDAGTFGADPAEYFALKRRADTDLVDQADLDLARRAVVFALAWILRWEAFNAAYPPLEPVPWRLRQQAPVTGAEGSRPVPVGVELYDPPLPGASVAFRIQLADLPSEGEVEWIDLFHDAMRAVRETHRELVLAQIDRHGEVLLHIAGAVDGRAVESLMGSLTDKTQELYERRVEERRVRAARAAEVATPYQAAFGGGADDVTFHEVSADIADPGGSRAHREDRIVITFELSEAVADWRVFAAALADQHESFAVFGSTLSFAADALTPAQAVECVTKAVTATRSNIRRRDQALAERARTRQTLLQDVRATLTPSGPPTVRS
jgi:hypothetical protein